LLDLRFCALGPEGMIVVCEALKVNTSVEKFLCLTNHLGPDGAKALLDLLQHNTNLKHINVEDNLFPPQFKKQLHEAASEAAIEIVL
jgi:Ran GTPase-activating protein (RanGAP) involved in mRNA processing and transport